MKDYTWRAHWRRNWGWVEDLKLGFIIFGTCKKCFIGSILYKLFPWCMKGIEKRRK